MKFSAISTFVVLKIYPIMGLLNQNNKKDDKKGAAKSQKGGAQASKFLNKNVNSAGFAKKTKPGSANRGS